MVNKFLIFSLKGFFRTLLLLICLEGSVGYAANFSSMVSWVWDDWLTHPVTSYITSSVFVSLLTYAAQEYFTDEPKKRQLVEEEVKAKIKLLKAETANKEHDLALWSKPEWQEAQIKKMAAEAFQKSDPDLLKLKKQREELEIKKEELAVREKVVQLIVLEKKAMDEIEKEKEKIKKQLAAKNYSSEEEGIYLSIKLKDLFDMQKRMAFSTIPS